MGDRGQPRAVEADRLMSHARFQIGFPKHRKIFALSDAAFRLWVSAIDHARDQGTDGRIDDLDLEIIPRCPPKGRKRTATIGELVSSGLWDHNGDHWAIHDFLDWQDSAEETTQKRRAAAERAKKYRKKRAAKNDASDTGSDTVTHDESRTVTHDVTHDVHRESRLERGKRKEEREEIGDPSTPTKRRPPDPMMASLAGTGADQREDVARVFARWRTSCGYPNAKLLSRDPAADIIAEKLDAFGEPSCLLVADEAPRDRMVNGEADEREVKHDTVRYIFGNTDAFNRILRAAETRDRTTKPDAADVMARAYAEEPDLSDYVPPEQRR